VVSDAKCGLLLIVCADGNGSNARGAKHLRAGASELSTRSHPLRVEGAGSLAPPLLTFRLASRRGMSTPEDR